MKPKFFIGTTDIKNNIIDINLKNKDTVNRRRFFKKFQINKEQPINIKNNNSNSIKEHTEKRIRVEGSASYNKIFEEQQMNLKSKNQIIEINKLKKRTLPLLNSRILLHFSLS